MASALFDSLCLSRLIKDSFEHLVGNKYTMYVLCWKIYRKASFSTFSQWVQINYIFTDNVRILCLSCNVKKSKTTAKLSVNSWNKLSNCFEWTLCDKVCQWFLAGRWFSPVLQFPPPQYNWNIVKSGVKHHNPPTSYPVECKTCDRNEDIWWCAIFQFIQILILEKKLLFKVFRGVFLVFGILWKYRCFSLKVMAV
jgi:hypothetical protein